MAKLTRALCDFCGGKLGEPHGTLTIPVAADSKQQPTPALAADAARDYFLGSMLSLTGIYGSPGKTRSFDICRDCGEGLTRWRHAAIEKLLAEGFEKA